MVENNTVLLLSNGGYIDQILNKRGRIVRVFVEDGINKVTVDVEGSVYTMFESEVELVNEGESLMEWLDKRLY